MKRTWIGAGGRVSRNANLIYVYSTDVTERGPNTRSIRPGARAGIIYGFLRIADTEVGCDDGFSHSMGEAGERSWSNHGFAASADSGGTELAGGGSNSRGGLSVDLLAGQRAGITVIVVHFFAFSRRYLDYLERAATPTERRSCPIFRRLLERQQPQQPFLRRGGASGGVLFCKPEWQNGLRARRWREERA